jgi:hypothetical protein
MTGWTLEEYWLSTPQTSTELGAPPTLTRCCFGKLWRLMLLSWSFADTEGGCRRTLIGIAWECGGLRGGWDHNG